MVARMEVDMVADMEVDMVADMEVIKVASTSASTSTWKSNLIRELVTGVGYWAQTVSTRLAYLLSFVLLSICCFHIFETKMILRVISQQLN